MAADAITINTTATAIVSIVTGVGGWFLGDIRDDLREVKGLLNAVLLRLGGAKPTP